MPASPRSAGQPSSHGQGGALSEFCPTGTQASAPQPGPSARARQAQAPSSLRPGHTPARPGGTDHQAQAQRDGPVTRLHAPGGTDHPGSGAEGRPGRSHQPPPTSGLRVAPTGLETSQARGVDTCLPRPAAHVGLAQTALGLEPARVFSWGLATTVHRPLARGHPPR